MGPQRVRIEIELASDQRAPRLARAALDRVTAGVAGDVGFRARLLVSELVTNSVLHRQAEEAAPIRLTILRTGESIRVEIRDHGRPFDGRARLVSERATSGRGLRLVQALVDRWGIEQQDGNLVWFEIDQPPHVDQAGGRPAAIAAPHSPDSDADQRTLAAAMLARAAQLIREGWCRGPDALDANGHPVEPWSGPAVRWSLLGAIVAALDGPAAVPEVSLPALATAMNSLADLIEERSLQGWNDAPGRTQRDVVTTIEHARMLVLDHALLN